MELHELFLPEVAEEAWDLTPQVPSYVASNFYEHKIGSNSGIPINTIKNDLKSMPFLEDNEDGNLIEDVDFEFSVIYPKGFHVVKNITPGEYQRIKQANKTYAVDILSEIQDHGKKLLSIACDTLCASPFKAGKIELESRNKIYKYDLTRGKGLNSISVSTKITASTSPIALAQMVINACKTKKIPTNNKPAIEVLCGVDAWAVVVAIVSANAEDRNIELLADKDGYRIHSIAFINDNASYIDSKDQSTIAAISAKDMHIVENSQKSKLYFARFDIFSGNDIITQEAKYYNDDMPLQVIPRIISPTVAEIHYYSKPFPLTRWYNHCKLVGVVA